MLFYNARYYDASLACFVSADSIVPNTSHRSLTVDFHETGFNGKLAGENNQNFWFMMSDRERQNATAPWGPSNPQELNRFSYVNNNPLKYSDPSGHSVYLSPAQATALAKELKQMATNIKDFITTAAFAQGGIAALIAFVAKATATEIGVAVLGALFSRLTALGAVGVAVLALAAYNFAMRIDDLGNKINDANTCNAAGNCYGVAISAWDVGMFDDEYLFILDRTKGTYTSWDVPWYMDVPDMYRLGSAHGNWAIPGSWGFCGDFINHGCPSDYGIGLYDPTLPPPVPKN